MVEHYGKNHFIRLRTTGEETFGATVILARLSTAWLFEVVSDQQKVKVQQFSAQLKRTKKVHRL